MKLEIPTKYFAIGGMMAFIAIISLVLINHHPPISDSIFPQHADSKLLVIYNSIPTQTGKNIFMNQSRGLTKAVDPELVDLDSQIISCSPNVDGLLTSSPSMGGSCTGPGVSLESIKGKYLSGQCCGVLQNTIEYHEHLEKFQQYSNIPDIPLNPYKTQVDIAKKWIDYDSKTALSAPEQAVYKQAMKIPGEGPCCCHCWHYYVNEGIAKKLIHDYKYNAKQVADFWNVSDICGV